ncbi:hypothetical protein ACH347_02075 [Saccharopolyspora sp. 5N102]|uniref:hypothetical protein n=1 Tax=Saccharopolyspora sp. 5N102 TaxID=3375155 RepID=UPI00379A6596
MSLAGSGVRSIAACYGDRHVFRHPQLAGDPHAVGVLIVVPAVAGTGPHAHRSPQDDEDFHHARRFAPHIRIREVRALAASHVGYFSRPAVFAELLAGLV